MFVELGKEQLFLRTARWLLRTPYLWINEGSAAARCPAWRVWGLAHDLIGKTLAWSCMVVFMEKIARWIAFLIFLGNCKQSDLRKFCKVVDMQQASDKLHIAIRGLYGPLAISSNWIFQEMREVDGSCEHDDCNGFTIIRRFQLLISSRYYWSGFFTILGNDKKSDPWTCFFCHKKWTLESSRSVNF